MKEKNYLERLFIPVHLIILILLIILTYNKQNTISSIIFIIFYFISFVWGLILLKKRHKFSILNFIGLIIVYGVGFYNMYGILSDGLSGLWS